MSWNYRVIHEISPKPISEDYYNIHEVYYDENDKITGWTVDAVGPCGETLEELRFMLNLYAGALGKPTLRQDGDTLVEESE